MSMISGLIDELNKSADEWNASNMFELARMCREAADTIWQLRDDLQRTNAENAKLRELVSGLEHCSQGFACDCCPLYDPSGTNHRRCESLEHELGIEVD